MNNQPNRPDPLEQRNKAYAFASSLSSISIALLILGCSLPCLIILVGTWLTGGK